MKQRIHFISLIAIILVTLTGCGAGSISFNQPSADSVYSRNETIDFSITFTELDASGAQFFVNGNDITNQFSINSDGNQANASIHSSNFADEQNTLEVVAGPKAASTTFYVDRTGPEFHITSVSPSFLVAGMDVTVSGYITDLSGVIKETTDRPYVMVKTGPSSSRSVAPIELDENNAFTVTFPLEQDPNGATGLEYRPIFFRANDIHLTRSNDAYAFPTTMPQLAKAKVTSSAFDNIVNPEVNSLIDQLNIESIIRAENPVVDKGWSIFSFQIYVDNFDVNDIDVDIQPATNGVDHIVANVHVDNLDVNFRTQVLADLWPVDLGVFVPSGLHHADVVGNVAVRFRVDGNQNLNPVLVVDDISPNLSVIGGDFDAIDFGFPVDVPGLGTLEQLIFEALDNYVANKIGNVVGDKAARKINTMLKLIPNDFDVTLRGKELEFFMTQATINADANGLEVAITQADVFAAVNQRESDTPKELGFVVHQRTQALPSFANTAPDGSTFDAGISIDWDMLNKTIYYAHSTGIDRLSTTIMGDQIPGVKNLFKDFEVKLDVKPLVSPHLDHAIPREDRAMASIQAKNVEIRVSVRRTDIADDFHQLTRIITNARADFDLTLSNNRLQLLLDQSPYVNIHSVDNDDSLLVLNSDHIQAIVDFAIPRVMPLLADAIEEIRLPSVAGYQLSVLEIETVGDRFFKIYADIH